MKFTLALLTSLFAFNLAFAQVPPTAKTQKAAQPAKPVPVKDPTGDRSQCLIGEKSQTAFSVVTTALQTAEAKVKDPTKASPELCKGINTAREIIKYFENYIAKPNGCKPEAVRAFKAELDSKKTLLDSQLVKQYNCKADATPASSSATATSSDPTEAVKNELTRAYVMVTNFHKANNAYPESLEKLNYESANFNVTVTYTKEGSGFLLKATDGTRQMSIDHNKRLITK